MHPNLLFNGEIRSTAEPLLSPGQTGYLTGWGVFSTLRVSEGILFAWERHWQRMQTDAQRLHVPVPFTSAELRAHLERLVEANHAREATLRVSIVRNRGGAFEGTGIQRDADLVAFTTGLKDWGPGARLTLAAHTRHGASPFAGAKINAWAHNLTLLEDASARGFDEVMLLNEHGHVSECTSANLFVMRGSDVLTPPLATSGCLPGVTRAILLEEINMPGLSIREAVIMPQQLAAADQVFMTSTTRDVLPVLAIDGNLLPQAPALLSKLQRAFLDYRSQYIAAARAQTVPA